MFIALLPSLALAQTDPASPRTAADSAIARARSLAKDGMDTDARRVIDSVLKTVTPDSAAYGEALYWRGALAATAADAERDYRRLLIETPLSPRAEDALLGLANLLQARGDRRGASDHLQRFMLTFADSPARPRVALSLVRLLFEQGPQQQARACEALRMGRDAIPRENLELRNQLDYYEPRCMAEVAVTSPPESTTVSPDSARTPPADSTKPTGTRDTMKRPSTSRDSDRKTANPAANTAPRSATSYYSVQVAAYNSSEPAQELVKLLKGRGLDARVETAGAIFRVRVGKYGTRADAVKAAAALKDQGHNGFITLVQGPTRK